MEGYTWADLENTEREPVDPPLLYVNLYDVYRAYGGPEEGGWWYTAGTPFSSIRCDSEEEARKLFETMLVKYGSEKDVEVALEEHFATEFPQRAPRYE